MAHYAAVISLKNTILRLQNSQQILLISPVRGIILESAYECLLSLQIVLKRWDNDRNSSEKIRALHRQITEAVCKLEDFLESHVLNGDERAEAKHGNIRFMAKMAMKLKKAILDMFCNQNHLMSGDMKYLMQQVLSFNTTIMKMEREYVEELDNPLPQVEDVEDEDDDKDASSNIEIGLKGSEWRKLFIDMISELCNEDTHIRFSHFVGMAGIGKTTLAKRLMLMSSGFGFECRAFVKMGQKYNLREILRDIVAQVNPNLDKSLLEADDDEIILECLWQSLDGKRFFIVLDDVWGSGYQDITRALPNNGSQGRVLITTRLGHHSIPKLNCYVMQLLDEEHSWRLFQRRMFGQPVCPPHLEEAGKKIAQRCEGLPLLIVTVVNLLSKVEKTPEYWEKVATDKKSSIFIEANDLISKVVYPSYNYLPRHSKACFLYMGAFPPNNKVHRSRLINLLIAEGFLEPNPSKSLQDFATKCFVELATSNVVVVNKWNYDGTAGYKPKSCHLHSVYWHMCTKEAGNEKFMHILNSYEDGLAEAIKGQRRLSVYNNVLFGIKDVYNSMASIATARSLLCTGPYHQYQVPICLNLRLLRVLDALTIRFYDFPMEVLKLLQLRYISLTYNGKLPPSISKLRSNLEYLIVHQHLSIISSIGESYLPMEIWDLQELKYLDIAGRNLPDPCGATLPNLQTLLDVGANSCTNTILEGIPNLNKLRVQIELVHDFVEPLSIFDHVYNLRDLKSLKCVVVNPELGDELIFRIAYSPSISTCHLKKLTLSGFGFPWEAIHEIAKLPSLEVLKLLCYAFQGEKWDAEDMIFMNLRYLVVKDSDLVQWNAKKSSFPKLSYITIKDCYELREIPFIPMRKKIRLVNCNPLAKTYANEVVYRNNSSYVSSYSSWDENAKPRS